MNGQIGIFTSAACAVLAAGMMTPVTAQGGQMGMIPNSAAAAPGFPGSGGAGGLNVKGTITAFSTAADTITITPAGNSAPVVVAVTSGTTLVGHEAMAASAISVGDTLLISGIPLAVQATSIIDAKAASSPSSGSTSSSSASGTTSAGSGAAKVDTLQPVPGVVTALSPLTVKVAGTFSVLITGTSSTSLSESLPITLSELAVGDTVAAQVMQSGSGNFTAMRLDVTAP